MSCVTSVDDIKLSFIDLIGQLIAMLSVVCVLAVKTRKVIGEIRSVYCLSLKSFIVSQNCRLSNHCLILSLA